MMDNVSIYNELPNVTDAKARLSEQLAEMGEKANLAELRVIFEEHDVQSRLGLVLLHNHFKINPGERVVKYGNISTPWQVPADGNIFGGVIVPLSWKFIEGELQAYDYGFNANGEDRYDTEGVPIDFARQVCSFLTKHGLVDILGICTVNNEVEGRIEQTVGRVSVMVPVGRNSNGNDIGGHQRNIRTTWSFTTGEGLESAGGGMYAICDCGCGQCSGGE